MWQSVKRIRRTLVLPLLIPHLVLSASAPGAAPCDGPDRNEPILPLPPTPAEDPSKVALGESLFGDARLSGTGRTSCRSCHDLASNGASAHVRDVGDGGRPPPFNTPTIFNVAHSFRLNWEGKTPSLPDLVGSSLRRDDLMGDRQGAGVERLRRDGALAPRFQEAYGRPPDQAALIDALSAYVASLTTPDSPFDRWLSGEADAIGPHEKRGYRLFRTFGCAACHQGANVGANLYQRHDIFAPLASPDPAVLRVPSLRNVAVTAPYFHDGSAATLEEAVRGMARAQLDRVLDPEDMGDIVAFLCALTGRYRGEPLRGAGSARACPVRR